MLLIFVLLLVYDFGRPYGESCYRLMSRTGQFIYLKTRGCLEVDEKTRQVHSFVCVNSLVSDEEGRRLIREMKKKFSAIISEAELSAMESDVPAVENPQKLERAILNLITNLNNPASYDDDDAASMISDSTTEMEDTRKTPLAIIAPKHNTIKNSIFKAVGVIGQASKGRSPSIKDEPKSPESNQASSSACVESTSQLSIKVEPVSSLLSPNSSMSSADSDLSLPFLTKSHRVTTLASTTREAIYSRQNDLPNNSNDFFTPFDNLSSGALGSDSIMIPSNNNNSSVNRNSVLKRVYESDDDDYTELIKKRAISETSQAAGQPNSTLDLLTTSDSGKSLCLIMKIV